MEKKNTPPRIALVGLFLECNRFAPETTKHDFERYCLFQGEDILTEAAKAAPALPPEAPAFIKAMNDLTAWEPIPLVIARAVPWGPATVEFMDWFAAEVERRLTEAGPVDGVYFLNHGAMTAVGDDDPDGRIYTLLRRIIGDQAPLISTVDLHANISPTMFAAADAIISYQTNPHVDQAPRAAQAAGIMVDWLAGKKLAKAWLKPPLVVATLNLLTARGPFAEVVQAGRALAGPDLPIVSAVAGFVFSDTAKTGMAMLAYGDKSQAEAAVAELADLAWRERDRFRAELVPLDQAIGKAQAAIADPSLPAVCLAETGDNPGGGGGGNASELVEAMIKAGLTDSLAGVFNDPDLAALCHQQGLGADIVSSFNFKTFPPFGWTVPIRAKVIALSDGIVTGRRGVLAGQSLNLGPTAAIDVGGLTVVVVSHRIAANDPAMFEHLGLDVGAYRCVALKSRGHFRAGFDEFFRDEQIVEAGSAGLTSPDLSRFEFIGLRRPSFPLDLDCPWDDRTPRSMDPGDHDPDRAG